MEIAVFPSYLLLLTLMPVKWQQKDSIWADHFIEDNNAYEHIYNVYEDYLYVFRVARLWVKVFLSKGWAEAEIVVGLSTTIQCLSHICNFMTFLIALLGLPIFFII